MDFDRDSPRYQCGRMHITEATLLLAVVEGAVGLLGLIAVVAAVITSQSYPQT